MKGHVYSFSLSSVRMSQREAHVYFSFTDPNFSLVGLSRPSLLSNVNCQKAYRNTGPTMYSRHRDTSLHDKTQSSLRSVSREIVWVGGELGLPP